MHPGTHKPLDADEAGFLEDMMKQEAAKERQWQEQQQQELQAYREVGNALRCSATVTAACCHVQPSCPGASACQESAMHDVYASARLHLPDAGSLARMQRAAVCVMYCCHELDAL